MTFVPAWKVHHDRVKKLPPEAACPHCGGVINVAELLAPAPPPELPMAGATAAEIQAATKLREERRARSAARAPKIRELFKTWQEDRREREKIDAGQPAD